MKQELYRISKVMPVIFFLLLSLCGSCSFFRQEAEFLIPAGYEGGVIVLFNQPDGIELEKNNDGTIIYRIPQDGFLKIRNAFERKNYKFSYFYVDKDGNRTAVEYLFPETYVRDPGDTTSKSFDRISKEEHDNGIFVTGHRNSNFNTKDGRVFLTCFSIGKPKDAINIYIKTDDKIFKIQKNILGIPEPSLEIK